MAIIDSYRRTLERRNKEIVKLQEDKAKESKKIADLTTKILRAREQMNRTKFAQTVRSKQKEIERHGKATNVSEKKIATIEQNISKKQKEIATLTAKILKEEQKIFKQQQQEIERQSRNRDNQIQNIENTLSTHTQLHEETLSTIKKFRNIPSAIVILFLASNPIDQDALRLDEEARSIREMIRKAKHRDSIKFETCWAVRPMDVLQAINEFNPAIVHFSGHGSDQDEIVFQTENGMTKVVTKEAIVQTMMACSEDIRLVFFNTCYSKNQAEEISHHVEATIGMKTSIGDEAARIFSSQFYSSISFGHSVKTAFEQAKSLLMLEGIPEEDTPQLFVNNSHTAEDIVIVKPQ